MKYAVISDIHGNLEAFSAVKGEIEKRGAEVLVCLGDIVGYGADPAACLDLLRTMEPGAVVRGNHDSAAGGLADTEDFTDYARAAVKWTAGKLGRPELDYLRALPLIAETDEFVMVHSGLDSPDRWHYLLSPERALPSFSLFDRRLCFFGHTHRPVCYRQSRRGRLKAVRGAVSLEEGRKYMINPGSVGQPRDGDPRACFALFDPDAERVETVRVDYDRRSASAKIIRAGLPRFLADRLFRGR